MWASDHIHRKHPRPRAPAPARASSAPAPTPHATHATPNKPNRPSPHAPRPVSRRRTRQSACGAYGACDEMGHVQHRLHTQPRCIVVERMVAVEHSRQTGDRAFQQLSPSPSLSTARNRARVFPCARPFPSLALQEAKGDSGEKGDGGGVSTAPTEPKCAKVERTVSSVVSGASPRTMSMLHGSSLLAPPPPDSQPRPPPPGPSVALTSTASPVRGDEQEKHCRPRRPESVRHATVTRGSVGTEQGGGTWLRRAKLTVEHRPHTQSITLGPAPRRPRRCRRRRRRRRHKAISRYPPRHPWSGHTSKGRGYTRPLGGGYDKHAITASRDWS
jgi:hypothetical protein